MRTLGMLKVDVNRYLSGIIKKISGALKNERRTPENYRLLVGVGQ
jgi:hypothetical protein